MKKIRQASQENEMDRLSDLPDMLIHHILSFMSTKDAVQTCVLSKRWYNLWTYLPTLSFDSRSFKNLVSFKRFVCHVLSQREPTDLHSLKIYSRSVDKTFISTVITYALLHSVQEIYMSKALAPTYEILYSKTLRTLHLGSCSLYGDHFSRCPNLQNLILDTCYVRGQVVKITTQSLVKVKMSRVVCLEPIFSYQLVVSSPRLCSFYYKGVCPSRLSMAGCPVLDEIDVRLHAVSVKEKLVALLSLSGILRETISHTNSLTLMWNGELLVSGVTTVVHPPNA